jgi:hypothetical protein
VYKALKRAKHLLEFATQQRALLHDDRLRRANPSLQVVALLVRKHELTEESQEVQYGHSLLLEA